MSRMILARASSGIRANLGLRLDIRKGLDNDKGLCIFPPVASHPNRKAPMSARIVTATVEGQKYQIPEMWLVGITSRRHEPMTYPEALNHWHQQAQMEREFNAQQRKVA